MGGFKKLTLYMVDMRSSDERQRQAQHTPANIAICHFTRFRMLYAKLNYVATWAVPPNP